MKKKEKKNNLISVIMPYYRKKKFLKQAVQSALNQSYKNTEIIIIFDYDDDDKSKDKDIVFIKKIEKLATKIKIIYNKTNIGAGASRNLGIRHAKGNYIAFLDSDDIWNANKLDLQMKFMKKNKADFSFTSYEIINSDNKKIGFRPAEPILNFKQLIRSCDIGLSTVVMKKKLFSKFYQFPNLKTKEDFILWLKLAKKKVVLHGLNMSLTKWRKTKNSLSSSIFQRLSDAFLVYRKYMKFNVIKSFYYVFVLSFNYILKKYL